MPSKTLITNAQIVNEGRIFKGSVLIADDLIDRVFETAPDISSLGNINLIDANGSWLIPGIIDDQVHFREPGLTHKAEILTESRAAVAGGITSFMEMPNTLPQATNLENLEQKFSIAVKNSFANYSFYMGATNDNLAELEKIDPARVCGIKVFMGSSTGNMLVDDQKALEDIFIHAKTLVATHCEDESTIKENLKIFKDKYGDNIRPWHHPQIRNHQACFLSSKRAVDLALKHKTRLHVLHLSTADEISLFSNETPLSKKHITGEVCIHHLWFTEEDYHTKGNFIKWNPAVKQKSDREALWMALRDNILDVVATDHAPHLQEEKQNPYLSAPSGGPLVQHSLQAMADACLERNIPMHQLVSWMCHNPAMAFKVSQRGFIREGYFADLVLLSPSKKYTVSKSNLLYKCGWSPFENHTFGTTPTHTFINGELVFDHGSFSENFRGRPLFFDR
ncbi:MAG: dihydroorotase [Bacteroidetes bacterium]|nr:MAG: dihydroorotase [Bacteroidota bacterium]